MIKITYSFFMLVVSSIIFESKYAGAGSEAGLDRWVS
jgi:hypothetical protein